MLFTLTIHCIIEILRLRRMKPPNSKTIIIARAPAVVEATIVWEREAMQRNMDMDVK